jgi:DNA-directed RNA polymerase subunit RPC12/RpoP
MMTTDSAVQVKCPHCDHWLVVSHDLINGEYDCMACGRLITLVWSLYKVGGGRKPNLLIMDVAG